MNNRKFIELKDTDLKLFKLAFGTVDAGGMTKDNNLFSCLDCYVEHGGNVIDTAHVYTNGQSEVSIGKWFEKSSLRDQITIITKGGHPPLTDLHHSRVSFKEIEADLNASLKSLKTDYIDIYFLHRDDINQPISNLIDLLEKLKESGKIKYYACSNFSAKRMREADIYAKDTNARGFVANQMFYNVGSTFMNPFFDDTLAFMDNDMKNYHENNCKNLAMPYFSVCSGFFHKLDKDINDENLKTSPYYTAKNIEIYHKLKHLCEKYSASLSQVLLGFYCNCNFNTIPLYSTHKVENLIDAMKFIDINFDKSDFNFE